MWSTGISRVVFESLLSPYASISSPVGRVRDVNVREPALHRTVRGGSCVNSRLEGYSGGRRKPVDAAITAVERYHMPITITSEATPGAHSLARYRRPRVLFPN